MGRERRASVTDGGRATQAGDVGDAALGGASAGGEEALRLGLFEAAHQAETEAEGVAQ